MARRVIAVQLDIALEEGTDYKELLQDIAEQVNVTDEFECLGIGFADDITECYPGLNDTPKEAE